MWLQKTDKADTELRPGVPALGPRERTMLMLADGHKSLLDFCPMFAGQGEQIVLRLVEQGYLTIAVARRHAPTARGDCA